MKTGHISVVFWGEDRHFNTEQLNFFLCEWSNVYQLDTNSLTSDWWYVVVNVSWKSIIDYLVGNCNEPCTWGNVKQQILTLGWNSFFLLMWSLSFCLPHAEQWYSFQFSDVASLASITRDLALNGNKFLELPKII